MTDSLVAIADADRVEAGDTTPVPWWSFGKTVLSAAALTLVADGRLSLDTPVRGAHYTLRMLLQHRSGLGDYGALPAYHAAVKRGDAPWPVTDMMARVEPATAAPDRRFRYSNVGYAIVRDLITDASGQDFATALDTLVLHPLEIDGVRLARSPRDLVGPAWGNSDGYDPGWVYHGLLVGPVGAAALLLHRLTNGDLLPASLLAEMHAALPVPGVPTSRPWAQAGYGLGLMSGVGEPDIRFEGHTGGGPGSRIAVYHAVRSGRTACVAAPVEDDGIVERQAMAIAALPPMPSPRQYRSGESPDAHRERRPLGLAARGRDGRSRRVRGARADAGQRAQRRTASRRRVAATQSTAILAANARDLAAFDSAGGTPRSATGSRSRQPASRRWRAGWTTSRRCPTRSAARWRTGRGRTGCASAASRPRSA